MDKTAFDLCGFVMRLVEDWNADRHAFPYDELPPACEALNPIWRMLDDIGVFNPWPLDPSSSSFTIAEVLKMEVTEYWGGLFWEDMTRYVSALPARKRSLIELKSFAWDLRGVLEGNGDPWGFATEEDGD